MKHEQSFADSFNAFMRAKAPQYGCTFHSFSVDGQDRDVGGDYVLTDASRFSIVEFKYTSRDLLSEKSKPRRLTLCQKLRTRDDMRALHDKCHFIAWTDGPSMAVQTNIYRHEICVQAVFGFGCGLDEQLPNELTRAPAALFAEHFFQSKGVKSLPLNDFQAYITWVQKETSESSSATLELLTHDPIANDLTLVRLGSLAEAASWLERHRPPDPGPRPRRRHGI